MAWPKGSFGSRAAFNLLRSNGKFVRKRRTREAFVPLSHAPGHAQVDFGEALGVIGGVQRKLHYFAMALPHSDERVLWRQNRPKRGAWRR
jgi:transposase